METPERLSLRECKSIKINSHESTFSVCARACVCVLYDKYLTFFKEICNFVVF